MIRGPLRRLTALLTSAWLTIGLLLFVGVWSGVASFIPQGSATSRDVVEWSTNNPALTPVAKALGLHHAFSAYPFTIAVVLLGVSTSVCAWRRTKVARSRSRTLRAATRTSVQALVEKHDIEVACNPALDNETALSRVASELRRLGFKAKRRGDLLMIVSPGWSVWGSMIFHWALVVLIAAVFLGQLVRSEGQMAITVGETKLDEPASYTFVEAGPWRGWGRVKRSVRVDAFDPSYKTGGIDRGAVPTVSVLDSAGKVIATRLVYPNSMLHSGSLAIHAPECGLFVALSLLDASGSEVGREVQLADFSQNAADGTIAVRPLARENAAGDVTMRLYATVPLDHSGQGFGEWIPKEPKARIRVTSGAGEQMLDVVLRQGEAVDLPGGGAVRLAGIGWFSWLSLVDDPTIPLIYGAMIIALLGLTLTLVTRQVLLVATIAEGPDGRMFVMNLRLWRNAPTTRGEVEQEITRALIGEQKG